MQMPDNVKIKVGIKSNKGIRKENNDDRVLIGMDPAANDWLFSPDQTQLGEFGLLIMIADGIGDSVYSGEGAQILCKTIKHLFDQTLELPPDDNELIRILEKYIHVANSHILWHVENHENISSLGVSFALGLIKSDKLYLVWCGNARVYRYQEKGVAGSFFTDHPLFELLTVDHTLEAEYKLFAPNSAKPTNANSLLQFLGDSTQTLHLSSRVLTFCQGDKILFSSEGLTDILTTDELASIISQNNEPQDIAGELMQSALNASTTKNTTASLIEIIEGSPAPFLKQKNKETLLDEAKSFFGLTSNLIDVPAKEIERKKLMAFNKMTEKKEDIPIEPMKVRTVLPDEYEELDKIDSKITPNVLNTAIEADDLMEQKDKLITEPLNEEKIDENEKIEIPIQADNSDKDISQQNDPVKEQSKLRIKVTVYPDSESNEKVEIAKPDSINDDPITVNSIEEIQESNPSNDDSEEGELIVDLEIDENKDVFSDSSVEIDEEEIDEADSPIAQMNMFENDHAITEDENQEPTTEYNEQNDQDYEDLESSDQIVPDDDILIIQKFTENQKGISEEAEMNSIDGDTHRKIPLWNSFSSFIDTVKPRWPYIIGIIIILLISMWVCNSTDENELIPGQLNGEDVSIPKPEIDKKTPKDNNEKNDKKEIITESTEKKTDPTEVNPEQKNTEKKEEKPKAKTIVSEPEYDAKIEQNKHQLLDEIVALWTAKKDLCKRITTYRKNAPEKKQEKLDALVYNCTQLEQKFSSIYDEKSGYFRTVRYDFLIGTITNIKVSLKQTEDKLEEIRIE